MEIILPFYRYIEYDLHKKGLLAVPEVKDYPSFSFSEIDFMHGAYDELNNKFKTNLGKPNPLSLARFLDGTKNNQAELKDLNVNATKNTLGDKIKAEMKYLVEDAPLNSDNFEYKGQEYQNRKNRFVATLCMIKDQYKNNDGKSPILNELFGELEKNTDPEYSALVKNLKSEVKNPSDMVRSIIATTSKKSENYAIREIRI